MKFQTDYCAYPPQIATDVEVTQQQDGERVSFVIGSASAGRYILLRTTEYTVLRLLNESLTPNAVCSEFKEQHGATLSLATLTKFLAKLDEVGILAGERAQERAPQDEQLSRHLYLRFKLFNPDRLFARLVPWLRWAWTLEFVTFTLLLMLSTLVLSLMNWAQVTSYGGYVLREHFGAVLLAALLVIFSHEFAHGLTCKAFGGRATEVGVLMVYYFLPALYCNVSGIHLIPQRSRRLWVILAGVYWQLLVGTFALLAWFFIAPYTLLSDLAFILFFGSVLNIAFNANPLIKLDGYYFLSQALRLPNLMDRSRGWWRRVLFGERDGAAARYSWREHVIYATFGLLSTLYAGALAFLIVRYVGEYLVNSFYLLGLLLTAGIALIFARRVLKRLIAAASAMIVNTGNSPEDDARQRGASAVSKLGDKSPDDKVVTHPSAKSTSEAGSDKKSTKETKPPRWRRRLVPLTILLLIAIALVLPWNASVGSYGMLVAIPGQEAIIRAPESATLIELKTRPGDSVTGGAVVGRLGNIEVEEQIVEVQSDLARANAEYDRLLGELKTRSESAARAELQLRQRQHDFDEINAEQQQINERRRAEAATSDTRTMIASRAPTSLPTPVNQPSKPIAPYPAAMAVLQAEVDLRQARLDEAITQLERTRQLHAQSIIARSELDTAETRASTLRSELAAAHERLNAALIDHQRKHVSTATEMNLARSDVGAVTLQIEKLSGELRATRALISTLESRRALLERKHAQFELITPRAGTVFGEELPRMIGQYFEKGAEICRIADTRQLLVRIQVPEREIGDVRVGHPVRLKALSFPDHIFRGVVTKIGGESEMNEHKQATYRVELTIENTDGLLRPGMSAFARIDFGRQMIGQILLHKIKQALRPELWML
jgi:putative peptide zinc metalloprotease protein